MIDAGCMEGLIAWFQAMVRGVIDAGCMDGVIVFSGAMKPIVGMVLLLDAQ